MNNENTISELETSLKSNNDRITILESKMTSLDADSNIFRNLTLALKERRDRAENINSSISKIKEDMRNKKIDDVTDSKCL
jgi:transcriptional regulator NrdR family protein